MNWYRVIKCAQVWETGDDDSFLGNIARLYELEYKYSMLTTRPFNGVPQRKENILERLAGGIDETIEEIVEILDMVFEDWLDKHALLDPKAWAQSRVTEAEEMNDNFKENVEGALFESRRYNIDVLDTISDNIKTYPVFDSLLEQIVLENANLIEDEIQYDQEYQSLETDEDREDYIEQQRDLRGDTTLKEMVDNYGDLSTFLENINWNNTGLLNEIYQVVFLGWFDRWSGEGIEGTIDVIEEIYNKIMNISQFPLKEKLGIINLAINASHQTGDMVDYLEDKTGESNIKSVFEELSNRDVTEWNEELKLIGLQI